MLYRSLRAADPYADRAPTVQSRLTQLLAHCQRHVPYYARSMEQLKPSFERDPETFLRELPVLTKDDVRAHFHALKSSDLGRRRWLYNTSGGSTGEPLKLIQDLDYSASTMAGLMLNFEWLGRRVGEPLLWVWGSERDVLEGSVGTKMAILNFLSNERWLNAFRITPDQMLRTLTAISDDPPKLIVGYVKSMYELARYAEINDVPVTPQSAILTSAGTLFDFMRQQIERTFECEVFNRYGSREVGNIAWECKHHSGLHAFPWCNYIEVLDDDGSPVPRGQEGHIAVTCLNNYAMPLIRYLIGDRGILSEREQCSCGRSGQILEAVTGRSIDTFRTRDGTLIDGEYFIHALYHREWVEKFQIVQKDYGHVLFRIVPVGSEVAQSETDQITDRTRLVLGQDCRVQFEFVDDLAPTGTGKYRYVMSEVEAGKARREGTRAL